MRHRRWYAFWDVAQDDDAAFEKRVDSVVREIGERGKPQVLPEVVAPVKMSQLASKARAVAVTSAPAPVVVPVPAVAPAPAPAPAPRAPAPAPAAATLAPLAVDELMRQVQQISSQLTGAASTSQLSEVFHLERERAAERERAERAERVERERVERAEKAERLERERTLRIDKADRESAERMYLEARLFAAFSVGTCTCGLGAAVVGAALLLKK